MRFELLFESFKEMFISVINFTQDKEQGTSCLQLQTSIKGTNAFFSTVLAIISFYLQK